MTQGCSPRDCCVCRMCELSALACLHSSASASFPTAAMSAPQLFWNCRTSSCSIVAQVESPPPIPRFTPPLPPLSACSLLSLSLPPPSSTCACQSSLSLTGPGSVLSTSESFWDPPRFLWFFEDQKRLFFGRGESHWFAGCLSSSSYSLPVMIIHRAC